MANRIQVCSLEIRPEKKLNLSMLGRLFKENILLLLLLLLLLKYAKQVTTTLN